MLLATFTVERLHNAVGSIPPLFKKWSPSLRIFVICLRLRLANVLGPFVWLRRGRV